MSSLRLNTKTLTAEGQITELAACLLHSATQAHVFHFQTTGYAAHKALQQYYEEIVDLVDELVEVFQGKYGRLKGYASCTLKDYSDGCLVPYFQSLHSTVEATQQEIKDTDINNILDEVKALLKKMLYLLTLS